MEFAELTVRDWAFAGGVLLAGIMLSMVVRRGVISVLRRGTTSAAFGEVMVGRLLQVVIIAVALVYALSILGVQLAPLLGALGIGGLAVALALQPTMENLFAGLILHAQRPLRVGEEIITGQVKGVVTDITSRVVVVQRRSGEIVHIPNSTVVGREIENLVRHGLRRTTLTVGVAYGSDLAQAIDIVQRSTAACAGVLDEPAPVVFAEEFSDSSIDLEVDYWHGPLDGDRRLAQSQAIVAIHAALADAGITIPFPQRTMWFGHDDESPTSQA